MRYFFVYYFLLFLNVLFTIYERNATFIFLIVRILYLNTKFIFRNLINVDIKAHNITLVAQYTNKIEYLSTPAFALEVNCKLKFDVMWINTNVHLCPTTCVYFHHRSRTSDKRSGYTCCDYTLFSCTYLWDMKVIQLPITTIR